VNGRALGGIEAIGGLEQALGAVGDQVVEVDGATEGALQLGGDGLHQGQVLLDQPIAVRGHGDPD
jgi:hypothetical protein